MVSFRKVEADDRGMLDAAAKADRFHAAAGIGGDRWANGNSLILADDAGPVLAVAHTSVARLDLQFLTQDFGRNARAVVEGFWRFVHVLQKRNVSEIIFNSESPAVVRFFTKRFCFRHIGGDTYSLRIK
jgi:hypothetical protein